MRTALQTRKNDGTVPMTPHKAARRHNGWRHWVEWRLTCGLFAFVSHVSWREVYVMANFIGDLSHYLLRRRRENAIDGLHHAFNGQYTWSEINAIARAASRNFIKSRLEFFRLATMSREELMAKTVVQGTEHLSGALHGGKGVLLVTLHLGSWEVMGARLAAEGYPITVIARPQNNPLVSDLFDSIQMQAGMKVVSKFNSMRAVIRALRANEVVGLLPDQHAGRDGLLIEFFGRKTPMHPVVPLLALRTGAAVVPALAVRDAHDIIRITVYPPIEMVHTGNVEEDIRSNTEKMTRLYETYIRNHPEQWLWMHRRWRPRDLTLDDRGAMHDVERKAIGD